ncbi:twin-arginine translocase subunit TatC [Dictyobacter aurantiacus]|uniref:Sec-independent protein translocase protein TatC n=1 Tax=Dictyobacter aurantiacus TaxID=1936993 RepID=A0A401ZF90_9CHLR|nr:twin-arginine translocase subunit TatC [Dictyobacter aurantiacus]GCE05535.1 Sec-independent protein translocase protein TatC [Dictyobacter aurantiacus]
MATSDLDQQGLLKSGGYDNSPKDDDENDPSAMSLIDHLEELRWRIFKCLIAVAVGVVIAFIFRNQIIHVLDAPLPLTSNTVGGKEGQKLVMTGIGEAFTVSIKLSIVFGLVFALPVILYQLWAFISPGLYDREKKHAVPFITLGLVLFVMGVTLGYFILQYPVGFLVNFGAENFTELISANSYFSFVSFFLLLFGAVFELPLVLTFLAMIGIVTEHFLKSKRAVAHVGMWAAATVVTPGGDLYSPVFIGVALSILYEFSIILIHFVVKKDAEEELA